MTITSTFQASNIAHEFINQAETLAQQGHYDQAHVALNKAKEYAYQNSTLLDLIRIKGEALTNARQAYINKLEEEASNIFKAEQFDSERAKAVLDALQQIDKNNELAHILLQDLPIKQRAERERRIVAQFKHQLEKIWDDAKKLEDSGAGTKAVETYQLAYDEAYKKASNHPDSIPFEQLKVEAAQKRNRAKEKWVGTPTLILDKKGQDLVNRYQTLKQEGVFETEFFNEEGEFLGKLPIDDCITKAKEMASHFADAKAQDYLDEAEELLEESPGAAYNKIKEALSLAYLSDFKRSSLELELTDRIEPTKKLRQKAVAQLNTALSKTDPEEAWLLLQDVERIDPFTPNLAEVAQDLLPKMQLKVTQLIDTGQQYQQLEDFEKARHTLQKAVDTAKRFYNYGQSLQNLYPQAQAAFEACLQAEGKAQEFDRLLDNINHQSRTDPKLAQEQLAQLPTTNLSTRTTAKIKQLTTDVNFRLNIEQSFKTLEQQMLSATDEVELIVIEETAKKASLEHPQENRFQKLIERIITRRTFLKACRLQDNIEQRFEAKPLLEEVIARRGDDAQAAHTLINKITASQKQEADIALAIKNAKQTSEARLAHIILSPYRHTVSRYTPQIRQLLSAAAKVWQQTLNKQLEAIVKSNTFNLPQVELLIQELAQSQSPRLQEWKRRALAPAYATAAYDLQSLGQWKEAEALWEKAFRLAPSNPKIIKGRQNAQKEHALLNVESNNDPQVKEDILNNLNHTYPNDPTIKYHLAVFYYNQAKYIEARMAISQAIIIAKKHAPLPNNYNKIHHLNELINEAENIEKHKLTIKSKLSGNTIIDNLWSAKQTYKKLSQDFPAHTNNLQNWWQTLLTETITPLKQTILKLAEQRDTVWKRTELAYKIFILQPTPAHQAQAYRFLKLTYAQLPQKINNVINNPEGKNYGSPSEALNKHITHAKTLQQRLIKIYQIQQFINKLKLPTINPPFNLDNILYNLELTLEQLYLAREKQTEIRGQIDIAMTNGDWEAIDDALGALKQADLIKHRSLKNLINEVNTAKEKRNKLEYTVKAIKIAITKEDFKLAKKQINYLIKTDPNNETLLRNTLTVIDPYTHLSIKGHKKIKTALTEKLAILQELNTWFKNKQQVVEWDIIEKTINTLAHKGSFPEAIALCQEVIGNNSSTNLNGNNPQSLNNLLQYLNNPPVSKNKINSLKAKQILTEAQQEVEKIQKQIEAYNNLISNLNQKQQQFTNIINNLRPLMDRLNNHKGVLRWLKFNQIEAVKQNALILLEQGRNLCPHYPSFKNFEENNPLLRS